MSTPKKQYDVVLSLLVYNQLEVTKECINSIFKTATSKFLLVISDNKSKAETAEYLQSVADSHADVVYVRHDENLGFILAHNAAYAAYSNLSEHFCVLNNDLVFRSSGWDRTFIAELQANSNLAQVGPVQNFGYITEKGVGGPRPDKKKQPDYIEGSCFVAKVSAIKDKLFESKYMTFAFSEDADLSFRLRSAGYAIKEIPGVSIQHKHHVSFKNETLDFDFKELERGNQKFLIDRWQKYLRTREFSPLEILVIRTGALGDAFMVEPILRELVNKYPGCSVYFQTKCAEWYTPCDYIKECGPSLKDKRKYDIVIDLDMAYERRAKMHVIDAYAEAANVILDKDGRLPVYGGLQKFEKREKTAVINAEGSWDSRQWPLDRIRGVAQYLKGEGYHVKEVGRTQSLYTGVGENLIGKLPFKGVVQTIAEASLYFGMDGGLAHFAQSVGTPSFLVFGCTNPEYRVHPQANVKAAWIDSLPCSGCHHEGLPKTFTKCATGKFECLTRITVEQVISQIEEWKDE